MRARFHNRPQYAHELTSEQRDALRAFLTSDLLNELAAEQLPENLAQFIVAAQAMKAALEATDELRIGLGAASKTALMVKPSIVGVVCLPLPSRGQGH